MPMSDREVAYLLISRGGVPHRNLARWSSEIVQRLARLPRNDRSPPSARRLISITNEAALVEAHRGTYETSAEICERQLACLRDHPDAHDFAIARCAINPWLNLGRLRSLLGHPTDACARFAVFADSTKTVDLAGIALDLGELNIQRRADEGYPNFCLH
jgi:hypothetical protein